MQRGRIASIAEMLKVPEKILLTFCSTVGISLSCYCSACPCELAKVWVLVKQTLTVVAVVRTKPLSRDMCSMWDALICLKDMTTRKQKPVTMVTGGPTVNIKKYRIA